MEKDESGEGSVLHGLQGHAEEAELVFCLFFCFYFCLVSGRDFEQTGSTFLLLYEKTHWMKKSQTKSNQDVCMLSAMFELCTKCCEGLLGLRRGFYSRWSGR